MSVTLSDVWFKYPRSGWVLRGVSLEFKKGLHVIVGPNGSGKTTLLRVICGFLRPQRGQVVVLGRTVRSYRDVVGRVVFVPANAASFVIGPTVRDDVERVVAKFRSSVNVDLLLELVKLSHLVERGVFELSEGELRSLALASALASDAPVLLLDEPTVGLDKVRREVLLSVLKREAQRRIIIVATNDLRLASRAERLVLLVSGEVLAVGSPREVLYTEAARRSVGTSDIVEFSLRTRMGRCVTPEELADLLRGLR